MPNNCNFITVRRLATAFFEGSCPLHYNFMAKMMFAVIISVYRILVLMSCHLTHIFPKATIIIIIPYERHAAELALYVFCWVVGRAVIKRCVPSVKKNDMPSKLVCFGVNLDDTIVIRSRFMWHKIVLFTNRQSVSLPASMVLE